jgi:hypothetical protein
MRKVFVSYSHSDSSVADRLVRDLQASEVPATYDKWLLRVGDSIIQRIAASVSEADSVIALLSPAAIESNWVKKELAFAMTGELQTGGGRVLPAMIADCVLPPMLVDKLYADFRGSYYFGLRQLLEALRPDFYGRDNFISEEAVESAHRDLEQLVATGDRAQVLTWFRSNGFALAALFGRLWNVSEAMHGFQVDNDVADFLVINGQSYQYELSLIVLGNPTWGADGTQVARREAQRLEKMLQWCRDNNQEVRRMLVTRMGNSYGAEQIAPDDSDDSDLGFRGHQLRIDAKLLLGRRENYGADENRLRSDIYEATRESVDIVSYDRVLDALKKILTSRW